MRETSVFDLLATTPFGDLTTRMPASRRKRGRWHSHRTRVATRAQSQRAHYARTEPLYAYSHHSDGRRKREE